MSPTKKLKEAWQFICGEWTLAMMKLSLGRLWKKWMGLTISMKDPSRIWLQKNYSPTRSSAWIERNILKRCLISKGRGIGEFKYKNLCGRSWSTNIERKDWLFCFTSSNSTKIQQKLFNTSKHSGSCQRPIKKRIYPTKAVLFSMRKSRTNRSPKKQI